ncbi:hypothetical protein H0R92_12955 [Treponema sp. OMZ 840]|uniref:hypothetical protein n=1 Tax=Treponema sp. OMZ 840 TaxID=244313 RepID=UPI003D907A8D
MKNYRLLLFIGMNVLRLIFFGMQGAVYAEQGQKEAINVPKDIFSTYIFAEIPENPELITEAHKVEKLNENEARQEHWRFAGEWDTVIICSSESFKIIYTKYKDTYKIQYVKLTGETSIASEWSSYIGKSTDYLLRIFGEPKRLNSSSIFYTAHEYYIQFDCDKKTISGILLARDQ